MLDLAFNLSNDPLFYIVTLALLVNLSGMTAWVFLTKHYDVSFIQHTKWVYGKFSVQPSRQGNLPISGQLIFWISTSVRRKESPQDDGDDHFSLFAFVN